MPHKIAVLGGGSWGIAVAILLHSNGNDVSIWEFNKDDCDYLLKNREHKIKLPDIRIPDEIQITNNLPDALTNSEIVCLAVPSHTVRDVCRQINKSDKNKNTIYINLAKGIEIDTLNRMSEVIFNEIDDLQKSQIATLSGPSHAEEVARQMPTSVVVGGYDDTTAQFIRDIFSNHYLRAYSSTDIIGVELGGALKNIIAIANGIVDGLGGGDNTKGALFTRGLAEISRLGTAMGANPLTFAGLSGLGDLVTTCISKHSRNRTFGEKIGSGKSFEEAISEMTMVVEGVKTTQAAYQLMKKHQIEMPITTQVYEVLFNAKHPQQALTDLMTRDLKSEI